MVPFYNGNFDGKVARFQPLDPLGSLNASVQELDVTLDRFRPGVYKGKSILILLCTSFIDWGVDTGRLSGRVRVYLARSRFLSFAVLLHLSVLFSTDASFHNNLIRLNFMKNNQYSTPVQILRSTTVNV